MIYKMRVLGDATQSNESTVPSVNSKVTQNISQTEKEEDSGDDFCYLCDSLSPTLGCIRAEKTDHGMKGCHAYQ
jgi:hypothetical protein